MIDRMIRSLFFVLCVIAFPLFGQGKYGKTSEDSTKCREYLSLYSEAYKKKSYQEAFPYWEWALKNCPASTKNLYIHAEKILSYKMKSSKTQTEKKKYLESLMSTYDQRNRYFPGSESSVIGKKAIAAHKYKYGTLDETYTLYEESLKLGGSNTDLSVLYGMFRLVKELYKEKSKPISKQIKEASKEMSDMADKQKKLLDKRKKAKREQIEAIDKDLQVLSENIQKGNQELSRLKDEKEQTLTVLFDVYDQVYPILEDNLEELPVALEVLKAKENPSKKDKKQIKKLPKKIKNYEKVKASIDKILAPLATCERLNKIYAKQYTDRKEDTKWLKKATKILTQKACYDLEIYPKIVEANFSKDPKAGAARTLAILSKKNKQDDKALKYYIKASDMESDERKKSKDYLNIAKIYSLKKQKTKAREYARKAARGKSQWGEPYILIGNLYASSANECGNNTFQKKAVYWAALAQFLKAMQVDRTEKNQKLAKKLIKSYAPLAPDKSLTFAHGYADKKEYTVKCWMNETVKIDQVSKL